MFSSQNNTRYYRIKIKGNTGTITFTEYVKKSFVTEALVKNLRKAHMSEDLEKDLDYNKVWEVTDSKQLLLFKKIFKNALNEYVNQIRRKVQKKKISIVKHELVKIIISPYEEDSLKVETILDIEVSV